MRAEFVKALSQAGEQDNIDARIDHIKRAVTTEVQAADPAVSVRFTEYFNHVVIPDMVLRWPGESGERLLFLRPSANPAWLEDDVATLASHRPMIFTLEDIENRAEPRNIEPTALLTERATLADTWIAGPSAMEGVAEGRQQSPVIGLLGQALVRGGRGVSTGPSVRDLTSRTERAFKDAERLESGTIAEGVASLERTLDAQQAGRLTRILRAVWEGHGGASSAFPAVKSTGPLTDDDLSYLMSTLEDAPAGFWRRVGKNVTTAQLGRLRLDDPSPSLQRYLEVNLEFLSAKGIRVSTQPIRLDESEDFPRWLIDRGCLAIRGSEWIAHIAARKAEEFPPGEDGNPLALAVLKERIAGTRAVVTRVEFGKGDRAVSYESKEGANILDDEDLMRFADEVQGMSVERSTLALRGGGTVNVEFASRTALGPTSSMLPVGNLARAIIPLVTKLGDDEASALNALLKESDTLEGVLVELNSLLGIDHDPDDGPTFRN